MVVNYLSKWSVVKALHSVMSARVVTQAFREVFADFGIPERIITDCGSRFVGMEFREFSRELPIAHETSSPLHRSSNGQEEKTIGTVIAMMKKCVDSGSDWLSGLLVIRNTPIDRGFLASAEHLQGRLLRHRIPVKADRYLVRSYDVRKFRSELLERKAKDQHCHDKRSGSEKAALAPGQSCYYKVASRKYFPGEVIEDVNDQSYMIKGLNGRRYRRKKGGYSCFCRWPSGKFIFRVW